MDSASQHSPKRLLRGLIAAGILATAWVAVDAITHSEPAAAAESLDIIPVGGGSTGDVLGGILGSTTTLVTPVMAPVSAAVAPIVTAVVTPIAPVVGVAAPVGSTVIQPLLPLIDVVVTPLAPLNEALVPVIDPLAPLLEPVFLPIAGLVLPAAEAFGSVAQIVNTVPSMSPNVTVLAAGGALVLGAVLAASVAPLLPAPVNRGPAHSPLTPAAPSGSNGSNVVALYGELNSGVPARIGAFGTAGAGLDDLPSSPTFASDTTPD